MEHLIVCSGSQGKLESVDFILNKWSWPYAKPHQDLSLLIVMLAVESHYDSAEHTIDYALQKMPQEVKCLSPSMRMRHCQRRD